LPKTIIGGDQAAKPDAAIVAAHTVPPTLPSVTKILGTSFVSTVHPDEVAAAVAEHGDNAKLFPPKQPPDQAAGGVARSLGHPVGGGGGGDGGGYVPAEGGGVRGGGPHGHHRNWPWTGRGVPPVPGNGRRARTVPGGFGGGGAAGGAMGVPCRYDDEARGEWVMGAPTAAIDAWAAHEREAMATYARVMAATEAGPRPSRVRVVFGVAYASDDHVILATAAGPSGHTLVAIDRTGTGDFVAGMSSPVPDEWPPGLGARPGQHRAVPRARPKRELAPSATTT